MKIAINRNLSMLNSALRDAGCKVDARVYFFAQFLYLLENDRKLLCKTLTASRVNGEDLCQKLYELFLYIRLHPNDRMPNAPDVSYCARFRNINIMPIVFDTNMRSLMITIAQKHFELNLKESLENGYVVLAKEIAIGGVTDVIK